MGHARMPRYSATEARANGPRVSPYIPSKLQNINLYLCCREVLLFPRGRPRTFQRMGVTVARVGGSRFLLRTLVPVEDRYLCGGCWEFARVCSIQYMTRCSKIVADWDDVNTAA